MMNQPTIEAVVRRMEAVERENRRWQWMVTVGLGVIAAVVVLGQGIPGRVGKVLVAEKFVLQDRDGRSRAELGFLNGASVLVLNDSEGRPGVALSVLPNGPRRVSLSDKKGRIRSVLTASVDGDSGLRLFDQNLMHRASLDVMSDGRPILRLADKEMKKPAAHEVLSRQARLPSFYHDTGSTIFESERPKTAEVSCRLPSRLARLN